MQRVQVLASGKYKFVKNLNSKPKGNPSTNRKSKRRSNPTPNKKNNSRKKGNHLIGTSFRLIRVGALFAPAATAYSKSPKDLAKVFRQAMRYYTGYSIAEGKFRLSDLKVGWTPYIAASVVTHGVPKITGFIKSLF